MKVLDLLKYWYGAHTESSKIKDTHTHTLESSALKWMSGCEKHIFFIFF